MKSFDKFLCFILLFLAFVMLGINLYILSSGQSSGARPYRVEIERIAKEIEEKGFVTIQLSEYSYVTDIKKYDGTVEFYEGNEDYIIREIDGELYRFDYTFREEKADALKIFNAFFILLFLGIAGGLFFIRQRLLKPFYQLRDVPYELSRGNLTVPIKENKNRFFGKFVWGIDMLRESIEEQKKRELKLQRDKKTLVLSLSHDIKTPLSAIKLYTKALSRNLYNDTEKQKEIAENINAKADEIEKFVSQITKVSREDFLNLEVEDGEFYLKELMDEIALYYKEKLELLRVTFQIQSYENCLLKGDLDRAIEVLQNLMENAIKYGDGHTIEILFSEEEGCKLLTVKNSGCTLSETDLPFLFESFFRGSNAGNKEGSGLVLYISRQLMHKMYGDIFAETEEGYMSVTTVFPKS